MRIEIMKREMKISFILALVSVFCVCNIQAEITWDSGHHIFSEGSEDYVYMYNEASAEIIGGEIWELYMYNSTTADISGGYVSILLGQDTSSVDVYAGSDLYLLRPNDSSTANVEGGEIDVIFTLGSSVTYIYGGLIDEIDADNLSTLYLYIDNYDFDPTGGTRGAGLITGTWIDDGGNFSISLQDTDTIEHINFVPEPSTVCMFAIGGLVVKRLTKKRSKKM